MVLRVFQLTKFLIVYNMALTLFNVMNVLFPVYVFINFDAKIFNHVRRVEPFTSDFGFHWTI